MASREFELGGGVKIGFSPLLVCMMLGTVFCNFSEYSVDIMDRSSKWTAPLYALFFVLSGAELDLGVFRYPATILIGVVYILTRCIGKYTGALLGFSPSQGGGCERDKSAGDPGYAADGYFRGNDHACKQESYSGKWGILL